MKDQKNRTAETEIDRQEPRIGVYVCHCGGNISDVVDVNRVAADAGRIPGVAVSRTNMFMCSDPGQKMIQEDIQGGLVDRVVVAACSRSLHQATFSSLLARNGLNAYLLEQANIREQCSWAHHGQTGATAKASTLVRAAIAKASRLVPLAPVRVEATRRALIIGGGVAGMRAAVDIARLGIQVALVEHGKTLGGFVQKMETLFPDEEPAQEMLSRLRAAVTQHPDIAVYTDSIVTNIHGYIGNFSASILKNSMPEQELMPVEAGAIVVATGFRPYEPAKKELGYKKLP
ncbi:MAG: CoB--CoM heterodisulfide reductase iron-sulfur subunit A family protein, partial [Acidobacteria bacterium]|nr:CoB--CoM heterodisulfide reductase iron-sulfur subunit A family protein [Acidobacteriota bacterium]